MADQEDNLSLYGIAEELQFLDDMLDSTGGEITEEWEQKQEQLLEMLTKKVDGCVGYVQKMNDLIDLARDKQEKLQQFITSKKNRIENFKHYIRLCMTKTGREEFTGVLCKIDTISGRESLKIEPGAEDLLPMEFIETKAFAKKKELTAAIKAGQTFKGIAVVRGDASIRFGMNKESRKRKAKTNANEQSESNEPTTEQPASNCQP